MYSRTSPIVVVGNALRAAWQLAVGGAAAMAALAALSAWGYQFRPTADVVQAWLVTVVTG